MKTNLKRLYWSRGDYRKISKNQRTNIDSRQKGGGFLYKGKGVNGKPYQIKIRILDSTFNWLGWDRVQQSVWDFLVQYPDKFLTWVERRYGIDLANCGINEFTDFLLDSGLIEIRGDIPPNHALERTRAVVRDFKVVLENLDEVM